MLGILADDEEPSTDVVCSGRFKSRADFDEGDFRLHLPRFSEENFPKNVTLADKIKTIADKYSATPSQIALAWILAEDENC